MARSVRNETLMSRRAPNDDFNPHGGVVDVLVFVLWVALLLGLISHC